MLAKKCDLCGNFYDHYDGWRENEEEANAIIFNDRGLDGRSTGRKLYDLCPECMNKILETMRNSMLPTLDEMRKSVADYCENLKCGECSIYKRFLPQLLGVCPYASNEDIKRYYKEIKKIEGEK